MNLVYLFSCLLLLCSATSVFPLFGWHESTSVYFGAVSVGGETYRVAFDPGSALLAIPGVGCQTQAGASCPHLAAFFDGNASSSAERLPCEKSYTGCVCSSSHFCTFKLEYLDGEAISGDLWTDAVIFGDMNTSFPFGVISSETSSFEPILLDGALGLRARGDDHVPQSAFSAFGLTSLAFCISRSSSSYQFNGYSSLLRNISSVKVHNVYSTSYEGLYSATLHSISLADEPFFSEQLPLIFDLGTSALGLPSDAIDDLHLRFLAKYPALPGLHGDNSLFAGGCLSLSDEQISMFPSLNFSLLGGSPLVVPPEYYLVQAYPQNGKVCRRLGILPSPNGEIILGAVAHAGRILSYSPLKIFYSDIVEDIECVGAPQLNAIAEDNDLSAETFSELEIRLQVNYKPNSDAKRGEDSDWNAQGTPVEFSVDGGNGAFLENKDSEGEEQFVVLTDEDGVATVLFRPLKEGIVTITARVPGGGVVQIDVESTWWVQLVGRLVWDGVIGLSGFLCLVCFSLVVCVVMISVILCAMSKKKKREQSNIEKYFESALDDDFGDEEEG